MDKHYSASQLQLYTSCPFCYRMRYIDKVPMSSTQKMIRGKAVHHGIEENFSQKIHSHKDLPLAMVLDITAAAFESWHDDTHFVTGDPGKAKDEAISLAKLYHEEIASSIQPVAVEQRIEIAFDSLPYTLLGYIDVIDDLGWIRDTKTVGRTPSQSVLSNNIQLTAYSLLYRTMYGTRETGVALDYLVSTKTPKTVQMTTYIDDDDIERLIYLMQMVDKGIADKNFLPNPNCYQCSKPGMPLYELNTRMFKPSHREEVRTCVVDAVQTRGTT